MEQAESRITFTTDFSINIHVPNSSANSAIYNKFVLKASSICFSLSKF